MSIEKKVVRDLREINVSTRGPLTPLTTMQYYSVFYCLSTIGQLELRIYTFNQQVMNSGFFCGGRGRDTRNLFPLNFIFYRHAVNYHTIINYDNIY